LWTWGAERVLKDMEQWGWIRQEVLAQGQSKRSVLEKTGLHWQTLEKVLEHSEPPGYQMAKPRLKVKLGPYLEQLEKMLKEDETAPPKQKHTVKRMLARLKASGYEGGYTQVKCAVRELRRQARAVFVPLEHRPGEAQVDFGHAYVKLNGELVKIAYIAVALPHSDAMFVRAYELECTETFQDGHAHAFEFFGGVPWRISYDNTSIAVKKIAGRERELTDGFLKLQNHYLFKAHFCRPGCGNEKGVVEGTVGFARRNYMVPVPENAELLAKCREDMERILRGQTETKAELLKGDQAAFLALPGGRFECVRTVSTTSNSMSLVRFQDNNYSVPVEHAHRTVVAKGGVDRVQIYRGTERIADHARQWGKGGVFHEPTHYLKLLEQRPGALDHARPLRDWKLPECFATLRLRLEEERENDGKREFIRVLRLLEKHPENRVAQAIEKGLAVGAHTRDAIAQFMVFQEPNTALEFKLEGRPHLVHVRVDPPCVSAYNALRIGGAQ
jgi:transposase